MARLPVVGSDDDTWGDVLNSYLSVSHDGSGNLLTTAIQNAGAVTSVNNVPPSIGNVSITAAGINAVPNTTTVNGHALSSNVTISASDVSAIPSSQLGASGGVATLSGTTLTASQIPSSVASVSALAYQRLIAQYGTDPTDGLPNKPWQPESTRGANLWATSNFSTNVNGAPSGNTNNTSSLTPSVSGASSASATLTRILLSQVGNETASRWRVVATVTVTSPPASGEMRLLIGPSDSSGTPIPFYDASGNLYSTYVEYDFTSTQIANPFQLNFEVDAADDTSSSPSVYFDILLKADAGTTGSTLALSNVSVYRVDSVTTPLRVAWDRGTGGSSSGGVLYLDAVAGYDNSGNLIRSRITFGPDSSLQLGFLGYTTYYEAANAHSPLKQGTLFGQYPSFGLGVNNCDITMNVYLADGVTTQYRGNTHGGEVGASGTYTTDFQVFLDFGAGWAGPYLAQNAAEWWQNCFRAKIVANTAITRTDQGSPFCTIAKTYYVYRDGTIRYDRTLTFAQAQKVDKFFWHMMSFDPVSGRSPYQGKLGQGLQVLKTIDRSAYLSPPLAYTGSSVTSSGGSIPANVEPYNVRVTTLDATGGESTGSITDWTNPGGPVVTVNGSTITFTWEAVSGAAGYAVYFGMKGFERRVAVVGSGTLSYTIMGTETPGQRLPQTNTAVSGTQSAFTSTGLADWSIYYDPRSECAVSLALDRAATSALPGVAGVRVDLQDLDNSLLKNYWLLQFSGSDLPQTIPNGTVFQGTVYNFCYRPSDSVNFERDQAPRAASASVLAATLYPST